MSRCICVENLTKTYPTGVIETQVLQGINLILNREFTCILGSSGSGKSTLLSLIGTLDKPTSGQIEIDGVRVTELKGNRLADFRFTHIGFVFQQFHLLPTLTVIENVLAPFFGRVKVHTKREYASELLEKLGILDKADMLPSQLSGGEQQRVAVVRALINKPNWLLADEPTGNLDSRNSESLFGLLQEVQSELNCGLIVVTHDQKLAERAERIIEIRDGAVVQDRRSVQQTILC